MTDQSSGRAAKSFFVFRYHPIPRMGFFHLPCISFKAPLCVSSPMATISFKCLSSAFITSSAVFPWNATSHGPPICLHVMVFMFHAPPFRVYPLLGDSRKIDIPTEVKPTSVHRACGCEATIKMHWAEER